MASLENKELDGWAIRSIQAMIGRELPGIGSKIASSKFFEIRQGYFRHFRIVECASGQGPVHAAYRQDNSSVFLLTGRQQTLRLIAAMDPVTFKSLDDLLEFAAFADKVTSEYGEPATAVSSVEEIPCPSSMAKHHRAVIETMREKFKHRVQPLARQVLPFGMRERFHVLATQKLIERTRMIASGGVFFRQDEVLADNLPLGR